MTDSPTIVKVTDPADLLRYLPVLAGVPIEDSLLLVLFRGRRTAGTVRIDLPGAIETRALRTWASTVIGTACRLDGVTGVVPVVSTSDTFAPSGRPPGADVLRAVARRARQAGLDVRDELVLAADGWGSLQDPTLPRGGRPLAEVEPEPIEGAPPPRTVPEPGSASPAARERFADHLFGWWAFPEGPVGSLHGVPMHVQGASFGLPDERPPAMERFRFGEDQQAVVDLIEGSLEPHDGPGDAPCACRALLSAIASRPGLPNLVLLQFAFGPELAARLWSATHDGDADSPELQTLQSAIRGDHRRPDPDRLERAIEVLLQVEALTPEGRRAPVNAMLAWLYWARGGGTIAGRLADRALAEDPEQELAVVVRALTDGGRLPAWAFSEDPTVDPFAVPAA